jgi:hypothetical protein
MSVKTRLVCACADCIVCEPDGVCAARLCQRRLPLSARPAFVRAADRCQHDLYFCARSVLSAQFVSVCAACACLRGLPRLLVSTRPASVNVACHFYVFAHLSLRDLSSYTQPILSPRVVLSTRPVFACSTSRCQRGLSASTLLDAVCAVFVKTFLGDSSLSGRIIRCIDREHVKGNTAGNYADDVLQFQAMAILLKATLPLLNFSTMIAHLSRRNIWLRCWMLSSVLAMG